MDIITVPLLHWQEEIVIIILLFNLHLNFTNPNFLTSSLKQLVFDFHSVF